MCAYESSAEVGEPGCVHWGWVGQWVGVNISRAEVCAPRYIHQASGCVYTQDRGFINLSGRIPGRILFKSIRVVIPKILQKEFV